MQFIDKLFEIGKREFGIRIGYEEVPEGFKITARCPYQIGDTLQYESCGSVLEPLIDEVVEHFTSVVAEKLRENGEKKVAQGGAPAKEKAQSPLSPKE
ncbi:MAG: hypothetical protein HY391_00010 [Deltaproteobacteria bacterium]|nr:hypothetical protein [Deltaproteobacteria bacterium]